jgi:hypothetical protein
LKSTFAKQLRAEGTGERKGGASKVMLWAQALNFLIMIIIIFFYEILA